MHAHQPQQIHTNWVVGGPDSQPWLATTATFKRFNITLAQFISDVKPVPKGPLQCCQHCKLLVLSTGAVKAGFSF